MAAPSINSSDTVGRPSTPSGAGLSGADGPEWDGWDAVRRHSHARIERPYVYAGGA